MFISFKLFLFILLSLFFQITSFAQVQIGGDINGEAIGDSAGNSISMPDAFTIAVGAPKNSDSGFYSGHVRIYHWNGISWIQKGSDIDGENVGDLSGLSVSMPDSNTVSIGAPYNDGNGSNSGHVRVYKWKGNAWIQKGIDLDGKSIGDLAGFSLSMPDSNTIAIGSVGAYGVDSGYVQIYSWDGVAWIQKGNNIIGKSGGDNFGWSISMPDSNTITVGAVNNDNNGSSSGHVQIYKWKSNAWTQKGLDINGEASGDISGHSVSMSDSNTVSIGAPYNDGNGSNSGHVRVYKWEGNSWTQKGTDIDGGGAGNLSGFSVSMSNNRTLAIGSPTNSRAPINSGQTKLYQYDSAWTLNSSFVGDSTTEFFGWSVSMADSNIFASGAPGGGGPPGGGVNINTGYVRIYSLCNSSDSINISACLSYTSPSNKYVWTTKGTYVDTITNTKGCDSIITIYLSINNSSDSISLNECYSYTSPSGKYIWTTNGIYKDTIINMIGCDSVITIHLSIDNSKAIINQKFCDSSVSPSGVYTWNLSGVYQDTILNSKGCDSLMTINLTINNSTVSSISPVVCSSYTSPSNNYTWATSGVYQDTILNSKGCDSLMTINLTINNNTASSISPVTCSSFTSPSNIYIWTASGTYMDTISNAIGCDSVITIFLTVNNSTTTIDPIACSSYTAPSGIFTWTTSGIFQDTIQNSLGCDSLITINLTINNSTVASISPVVCSSYTSPSNNYTWATSGIYMDTIPNSVGCDSAISINLSVDTINIIVDISGDTLISQDTSAAYQWVNCLNNYRVIIGETSRLFEASLNGNYAVLLSKNGCIDTSACYNVIVSGISSTSAYNSELKVYPNPSQGLITIDFTLTNGSKLYTIRDVKGKIVKEDWLTKSQTKIDLSKLASGIYMLQIEDATFKLVFD